MEDYDDQMPPIQELTLDEALDKIEGLQSKLKWATTELKHLQDVKGELDEATKLLRYCCTRLPLVILHDNDELQAWWVRQRKRDAQRHASLKAIGQIAARKAINANSNKENE